MQEPESISDLLAAQPTEALDGMLQALRFRITEIQIEMRMVERELRKRRNARAHGGKRAHVLKREDVLAALKRIGRAAPPAVASFLNEQQDLGVSANAVRNHLVRLVEDDAAIKHDDGTYSPTVALGSDGDTVTGITTVAGDNGMDSFLTNGPSHRVASGDEVQGQFATDR